MPLNAQWFKDRQKAKGVTADKIADRVGRSRSNVSNIYAGTQRMSMDWARAFAAELDVSLDEVMLHAGLLDEDEAAAMAPGFSEGDATPYASAPGIRKDRAQARAAVFGGDRPGVDVWTVQSRACLFNGLLPGDSVLVDTHQSERARAGDLVLAQIYDYSTGSARTVLRRFEPPVLVAASPDPADNGVHVVDGRNVLIRGRIIASWREDRAA